MVVGTVGVMLVLLIAVVADVVVPVDDVLVVDGLAPLPPQEMEAYEVPTLGNAPQNDSPECVRRVAG